MFPDTVGHNCCSHSSPCIPHFQGIKRHPLASRVHAQDHMRYALEVGVTNNADYLQPLLKVLVSQGQEIVAPDDRRGLHPLVIPLARGPVPSSSGHDVSLSNATAVTCLLRWPTASSAEGMSVVRMSRDAPAVSLMARSPKEYLTRLLAEEDHGGQKGTRVADSIGEEASQLYSPGSVSRSSMPSLDAWLTKEGCMFPDVMESLVMHHLSRGDQMSAMIASEWYMKRAHFPGWARPFEFNAQLYSKLGREEEARDSARVALYTPWWTLKNGFRASTELARFPATADAVKDILSEVMKNNEGGPLPPGIAIATKTDEQLAVEAGEHLMNTVAAGEASWDGIRAELADRYQEGKQGVIADFIRAAY